MYRLGKLSSKQPYGLGTLATYVSGRLPTPPASVAVPNVSEWGMALNDSLGDCTVAGVVHIEVAANADVSEHDTIPTDDEIKTQYFAFTGGQDTGCVEADVLQAWYRNGLFGRDENKIGGYVRCDRSNNEVHNAIAQFGACYVGVQCPASAQEQFEAGEPWTVVPDSPIEGGHCIVFVGYDANYLYAVTWGGIAKVSYPWWTTYGDEAWAVIPQAFVEKGGYHLDIASLRADLDSLE
jgi:hypothetical protein